MPRLCDHLHNCESRDDIDRDYRKNWGYDSLLSMVYSLQENEPFSTAIKRITLEQIDVALDHLAVGSEDRDEPIHATRQSLKRIRALLCWLATSWAAKYSNVSLAA